jgi:dihydrofolate reductase
MGRLVLYVATSLDGYIARTDGGLDWLDEVPNPDREDHGYHELLAATGSILVGRATYEKLLGFGIEWPYPDHRTFVVSRDPSYRTATPNTEVLSGDLRSALHAIKRSEARDTWLMGGGVLLSSLLGMGEVDRMILSIVPTVLGKGIPLFPDGTRESRWRTVGSRHYPTGIVGITCEPA